MARGGPSDADAGFVLVHGGVHRSVAWAPLLPHLNGPAVAIDLPGRHASRSELAGITLEDTVKSAVADIEATGWRRVTLVGHSLAGLFLPEITARLGETVRHVVFIACAIPPDGRSVVDTIPGPIRLYARRQLRRGHITIPPAIARRMFCNGMDAEQTRFVIDQLCSEPPSLLHASVPPRRWSDGVGRTYVLLRRDRSLPPWYQRRQIRNLGPCEVVECDGPHDAFVSRPREMAEILNRYPATSPS